jgi:His-Xaa-Ser system protein HxsD
MVAETGGGNALLSTRVSFDSRVYALPVIKKAAYRFLKRFVTEIALEGTTYVCTLKFVVPGDAASAETAQRDLQTEVLDQDLRASIALETESVRNAVLGFAFSRTGLQGGE